MVIIGLFLQSYPSPSKKTHTQNKQTKKTTKKSDFWKMKKIAAYNIILHMCTKNNNRMRYGSLDTEWDRHNFLSLLLLLLNNPENQNFEEIKQASGDVIILHMCTKNHNQMMYMSWDMECNRPLDHFLLFYPTIDPNN